MDEDTAAQIVHYLLTGYQGSLRLLEAYRPTLDPTDEHYAFILASMVAALFMTDPEFMYDVFDKVLTGWRLQPHTRTLLAELRRIAEENPHAV